MIRFAIFFNSMIIVSCVALHINKKDRECENINALVLEIKPQIVSPKQNAHRTSFRYLIKTDKGFMAIDTFFFCEKQSCQTYAYGLKEGKKYNFTVKGFSVSALAQYTPRYIIAYNY